MNTKFFGLALATTGMLAVAPALAQMPPSAPPCGPRALVVEQLQRDFSETVVSRGLGSNGAMFELLVSPKGTWTMLVSLPNGNSCFGAAGEMWEEIDKGADDAALNKLERPANFKIRSF